MLAVLVLGAGSAVLTARGMITRSRATHNGVATSREVPIALQATPPEPGFDVRPELQPAPTQEAVSGPGLIVPILLYHYIRVNPNPNDRAGWSLSVTPENFEAQMRYLKAVGANTVTLADVRRAVDGGAKLPPHPVVLTFDDGYEDF
ncbi:MAG TPA: hypothetical protein VE219_05230, partial [Candidatus Sulfotelmatobacter sp.]|nr:hypothetical protein [Candidatus Sulfotelmatobacter sp.]